MIDVTRDIFTGVIEIEPGVFVMNPLDGRDIVAGLTPESMTPEILAATLKTEPKFINPLRDTESFLVLWKEPIDRKINFLSKKFENILLLEIYFTHRIASHERPSPMTAHEADTQNSLLASMYEHMQDNEKVTFVSIEQDHLITGRYVAWGGPSYTHFINETYALFCDAATAALTQSKQPEQSFLRTAAIDRAKKYEDTRHALQNAEERYKEASQALTLSESENAKLKDELEKLRNETTKQVDSLVDALGKTVSRSELDKHISIIAQRDAQLTKSQTIALEQAEQLNQARARIEEYSKREKKLEADILATQTPLLARLSKSTARGTYSLRRKLRLTRRR